jgi:hypothetical protein
LAKSTADSAAAPPARSHEPSAPVGARFCSFLFAPDARRENQTGHLGVSRLSKAERSFLSRRTLNSLKACSGAQLVRLSVDTRRGISQSLAD